MAPPAPVDFRVTRGTCHALFAYDVGWAIRFAVSIAIPFLMGSGH